MLDTVQILSSSICPAGLIEKIYILPKRKTKKKRRRLDFYAELCIYWPCFSKVLRNVEPVVKVKSKAGTLAYFPGSLSTSAHGPLWFRYNKNRQQSFKKVSKKYFPMFSFDSLKLSFESLNLLSFVSRNFSKTKCRLYWRLEMESVIIVFSTQLCELLPF